MKDFHGVADLIKSMIDCILKGEKGGGMEV